MPSKFRIGAGVVAGATTVLTLGLVAPGAAQAQQLPAGTNTIAIEATGVYTGALVNGLTIAGTCAATAEGAVSAIVIDECKLTNLGDNHPSTAPGTTSASAFTDHENTLDFALCWHAYAIPELDPTHPVSTSGCTNGVPTPGVGGSLGGSGVSTATNA